MEKSFSFVAAYKRFLAVTHTSTQTELAACLKIKQSSISDARKRETVPCGWYMALFEKMGVNPDWLKWGEGPRYLRTRNGYLPVLDKFSAAPAANTPLARPAQARVYRMHGGFPQPGQGRAAQPQETIALPEAYAQPGIVVLRVENDAFAPTVRRGAHVGIDPQLRQPVSGLTYALLLQNGEIALRRLFWEEEARTFLLRAENPVYQEVRASEEDCAQRLLGRLTWVLHRL